MCWFARLFLWQTTYNLVSCTRYSNDGSSESWALDLVWRCTISNFYSSPYSTQNRCTHANYEIVKRSIDFRDMASCHLFALCIAIFESGFLFGMHCGRISRELCDCVSNKILLLCYVVKIEYNFPQRWITSKNDCKSCTKIGCLAANWQLSVTDITIHEQTQYIESIAWNRFESVQIIDRFSVQIDFLRHSCRKIRIIDDIAFAHSFPKEILFLILVDWRLFSQHRMCLAPLSFIIWWWFLLCLWLTMPY